MQSSWFLRIFSEAQLWSCIYHDNLRHGNCRVPIVTTPSWFYQSQLALVPAHQEFCCEHRWWLQERHTQRKKRCSVTDSLEQNSADKIFNSLELSDLTSLEMAISISWLKYWGAPPFPPDNTQQLSRWRMWPGLFWVPIAFQQQLLLPISRDGGTALAFSFDNSFIYSPFSHDYGSCQTGWEHFMRVWSQSPVSTPPYFSSFLAWESQDSRLWTEASHATLQHGDGIQQSWRRRRPSQELQQQNRSKNCVIGSCKTIDTW